MINLDLLKDQAWEQTYDGIIESYIPGKIPPPEKYRWLLHSSKTLYDIDFSTTEVRHHVVAEEKPVLDGSFLSFRIGNTTYAIPSHLIATPVQVKALTQRTFFMLIKSESDACPRLFPNEEEGRGKVVVKYWKTVSNEEEMKDEDENS